MTDGKERLSYNKEKGRESVSLWPHEWWLLIPSSSSTEELDILLHEPHDFQPISQKWSEALTKEDGLANHSVEPKEFSWLITISSIVFNPRMKAEVIFGAQKTG